MKVTLTIAELTELVIERYRLPGDTCLEISGIAENPAAERIIAIHRAGDCLDTYGNIRPDKKIAAIKLLRDYVINLRGATNLESKGQWCGLANAKYAVEEYRTFLDYVRRFGVPDMGSNDNPVWRNPSA